MGSRAPFIPGRGPDRVETGEGGVDTVRWLLWRFLTFACAAFSFNSVTPLVHSATARNKAGAAYCKHRAAPREPKRRRPRSSKFPSAGIPQFSSAGIPQNPNSPIPQFPQIPTLPRSAVGTPACARRAAPAARRRGGGRWHVPRPAPYIRGGRTNARGWPNERAGPLQACPRHSTGAEDADGDLKSRASGNNRPEECGHACVCSVMRRAARGGAARVGAAGRAHARPHTAVRRAARPRGGRLNPPSCLDLTQNSMPSPPTCAGASPRRMRCDGSVADPRPCWVACDLRHAPRHPFAHPGAGAFACITGRHASALRQEAGGSCGARSHGNPTSAIVRLHTLS
eukprot:gene17324-biopygen6381